MLYQTSAPHRLMSAANALMIAGTLLLLSGISGAYLFDQYLAMGSIVAAHALVILGPTALKIGYVMRLLAERREKLAA
ncbi:hypothetical protein NAU58_15160 [Pseudomonas stutzeri]|uniref:Transmembrane sensor/regulator PpyR n=1 Tax=Stutzerimonas stutzeri TaxID=316 RepID=A0A2N8S5N6_STUST|nr:hypothetical protein [Stutzerimonas stutzeri]MCQ4296918.1 hypothetical protein [Stutzerimonas stutzeri]PNF81934.1 hypothetical protein CXK92_00200 [Stutzerimonas stutzeri]